MGNMRYCRFQNTLEDLTDCLYALEGIDGELDELSPVEKACAKRLIEMCQRIGDTFWRDEV